MNITQQLWAVKEWTRVKATGNEFVELVHSATNEEKWGPTGQQMEEICISFRSGSQEIMDELRWRLKNRDKSWRSCYKSLLVLDYLARNVSDNYLPEICSLVPTLRTIAQSFYYTNPKGVDHGVSVRERAKNLADLLSDGLLLREERAKALQTKQKLSHNASDGGGPDRFSGLGGNVNSQDNFYPSSYQYGRNNFNSPNSNANRFNGGGYDPYRPTGSLASRTNNSNIGATRLSANNNNNNNNNTSPHVPRSREEQERYDLEVALRLQREEERRAGVNSTMVEEMYARDAQRRRAAEMRDKEEVSFASHQKSKVGGNTNRRNNHNNDDEDEDDEALARRLQAEEEERARREGVSLPTLRSDAEEQNTKAKTKLSSSFTASSSSNTKTTKNKTEKNEKNKSGKSESGNDNTLHNENTNDADNDKTQKSNAAAANNVLDDLFAPAPQPQPQSQQPSSLGNNFTTSGAKAVDSFDTFLDNRAKQQQQQVQGQMFGLAQGPNSWQTSSMSLPASLPPPSLPPQTMMMGMNNNNYSTSNNMNNPTFQSMPGAQPPFQWTNNTTSSKQTNFVPAVNQWGMPMQSAQASAPNTSSSYDDNINHMNNNININNDNSNANMMANMAVANDIFGGQTSSTPFANNNSYNSNNNDLTANSAVKVDNPWMTSSQQAPGQQQPPLTTLSNTNDNNNTTANMWASLDQFAQRKRN